MALYRNVHVSFWQDSKVCEDMTVDDRYVLLYLLTNPYTNMLGCYEISRLAMSRDLGFDAERISATLEHLHALNVLDYCDDTREVLLYHWSRYNWSASPKTDSAIARAIPLIKFDKFRDYVMGLYNQRPTVIENGKEIGRSGCIDDSHFDSDGDSDTGASDDNGNDGGSADKGTARRIVTNKHKHGEYQNVLLTDAELDKLKGEFPNDWQARIDRLSEYIESKGAKYKSHYATIRAWARNDSRKESAKKPLASGEGLNDDALGEWL